MKYIIILLLLPFAVFAQSTAYTTNTPVLTPHCWNGKTIYPVADITTNGRLFKWIDSTGTKVTPTSQPIVGSCKVDSTVFCLYYEIVDSSYSSDSAFIKLTNQRIDSTNAKLDSLVYYTKLMAKRVYNTNEATYLGNSSTATFAANTYHSVSVVILSSTADIYVGGVLKYDDAPIGFSTSFTATELLANSIQIITDAAGKAFITTLK